MKTFQENLGKITNSTPSVLQHIREGKLEFDIFDGARSYRVVIGDVAEVPVLFDLLEMW